MKPVHIEFVEDRCWQWIWSLTVVCCLILLGSAVWRWQHLNQAIHVENDRLGAVQLELQQIRIPVQEKVDHRYSSLVQASKFLQMDINRAFTTTETLQESEIRLRSLTLETTSDSLKLEYEIDSILRATAVTDMLNAGYELRPWQLESVSRSSPENLTGAVIVGAEVNLFRGIWSVQFSRL